MRVRLILVLLATMCFVLPFSVLPGEARSDVKVSRIPKHKFVLNWKGYGQFRYNAKSNTWMSSDPNEHPVVIKPVFIGKKKLPAYDQPANQMGDCVHTYIVLTDQSYAILISASCELEQELDRYVASFRLPKGVHAIRAREKPGWEAFPD